MTASTFVYLSNCQPDIAVQPSTRCPHASVCFSSHMDKEATTQRLCDLVCIDTSDQPPVRHTKVSAYDVRTLVTPPTLEPKGRMYIAAHFDT